MGNVELSFFVTFIGNFFLIIVYTRPVSTKTHILIVERGGYDVVCCRKLGENKNGSVDTT